MPNYPIPPHDTWDIHDSTKVTDYASCARMYFFKYVLGYRSTYPNNDLVFGISEHKAQEFLLRQDNDLPFDLRGYPLHLLDPAQGHFLVEYRKEFDLITDDQFSPKNPGRAHLMRGEYCKHYNADHFKVLHTEIGGTVPVNLSSRVMHFKIDAIIEEDNKLWVFDHKTTKSIGRVWEDQFTLAHQTNCYVHAACCYYGFERVSGFKVNGLVMKKTKSALFDFVRKPIRKEPAILNA